MAQSVSLNDWVPVGSLQILCKYLIADLATLLVFFILTTAAEHLFPAYHDYIVRVEITGLILLLGVTLCMLIVKMIKGESHGSKPNTILAL
jgi:hypothetical protein